jgi:hypothetical protein
MARTICNSGNFVSYSVLDWQPMQFTQQFGSRNVVRRFTYNTSKRNLYTLQFSEVSFSDAIQNRVTIIASAGDSGTRKSSGYITIDERAYVTK